MDQPIQGPQTNQSATPASVADLYGSRYQAAKSWKHGDVDTTIVRVGVDKVQGRDGSNAKTKIVLQVAIDPKPLLLNKTNASILAAAYGDNPTLWIGKPVRISIGQVMLAGSFVDSLLVSVPK